VLRAKYFNPRLPLKFITFVEAQTRQNKRMDVDITFGNEKFVVELKVCVCCKIKIPKVASKNSII
ncbi:MAG TPA: hypothetical protein DEG09_03935, partial [Marinilabiliaceae bacterium]|nr:hypothetical protein [Marinilabiliaceae bacterium]